MTDVIFADGIRGISVAHGVVRLQLALHERHSESEAGELKPTVTLVMPVEGFASTVPGMQQVLEKLVKDGVLKKREAASPSPNFQ